VHGRVAQKQQVAEVAFGGILEVEALEIDSTVVVSEQG